MGLGRESGDVALRPIEDMGIEQEFHFFSMAHSFSTNAGLAGS